MILINIFIILSLWINNKNAIQNSTLEKYKYDYNICIGGPVYNCEKYLNKVCKNILKITKLFKNHTIIIAIDQGSDNSLDILKKWKSKFNLIISEGIKTSEIRTENICKARNRIIQESRELHKNNPFDFFIMMDCDSVTSNPINLKPIRQVLKEERKWDMVSFNLGEYYDIWALSIKPYLFSCWHFQNEKAVIDKMRDYMLDKLSKNKWVPVQSAFCGFAIYKPLFLNLEYDWRLSSVKKFLTEKQIEKNKEAVGNNPIIDKEEECEHRYFHFTAYYNHNARLYVYSDSIF